MKDIKGYEGIYGITSCGKVWSYRRKKFLELTPDTKGYLCVSLQVNGNRKTYKVHRLVAEAHIPNPENLPQVNHRDENKKNNCLQNLEWCDCKYNNNYGTRNDRLASSNKKPILQFTLEGEFVREWPSTVDVGREVSGHICNCLKGRKKSAYGFVWKYKE